jgi:hypothetical protein
MLSMTIFCTTSSPPLIVKAAEVYVLSFHSHIWQLECQHQYCIKFYTLGIVATIPYKFFADDTFSSRQSCFQDYAAKSDGNPASHEEMFVFLDFNYTNGPQEWYSERWGMMNMTHWNNSGLGKHCAMPPSVPVSSSIIDFITSSCLSVLQMRCFCQEYRMLRHLGN